jgi:cell fate regulator YaaT (PSP1 superfamily)
MEQKLAIKLRNNEICPITPKSEESIRIGYQVIVKTNRGEECGKIVAFPKRYPHISKEIQLKKVIRYATEQDIKTINQLPEKEARAQNIASAKSREFELPIKIISTEYLFDGSKIYFYYKVSKEQKIKGLREYRKDLSSILKAEVNLRNLNAREEAKHIGGLGPCGRNLCCAKWLNKSKHITVKMVKEQGFQISPLRTSGLCGRLMCCFDYEHEAMDKEKMKHEG